MSNWKRGNPAATSSAAAPESSEAPKPVGPSDVVACVIRPLREEVLLHEDADRTEDRRFRRELEEVLYDCEQGLTPHTSGTAIEVLDQGLESWFERRRIAEAERNAEMTEVIVTMGKALKGLQGDDGQFFENLTTGLTRLKSAADNQSVRNVSARLGRLVDDMTDDITAQKAAAERRIRQLSGIVQGLHDELNVVKTQLAEDALMGLYNRGTFDAHLAKALARCRLAPYRFTLVLLDLDRFKLVNDNHGHVAGDRVLKQTAAILQATVLRKTDLIARYGGEEMAIILDDSGPEDGLKVAEDVRKAMENAVFELNGEVKHRQTASFGVAQGSEEDSAEDLIERSDECLYLAKKNGRNRVVVAGHGDLGRRVAIPRSLRP